jgi:hypothetical protein
MTESSTPNPKVPGRAGPKLARVACALPPCQHLTVSAQGNPTQSRPVCRRPLSSHHRITKLLDNQLPPNSHNLDDNHNSNDIPHDQHPQQHDATPSAPNHKPGARICPQTATAATILPPPTQRAVAAAHAVTTHKQEPQLQYCRAGWGAVV